MHGQQNDKYTEMHGHQNDKYTEMHGQQNLKKMLKAVTGGKQISTTENREYVTIKYLKHPSKRVN